MHIARRVCRNPDESKYIPISLDLEILRLICNLSKFKKQYTDTDTDLQHVGIDERDARENFIQF